MKRADDDPTQPEASVSFSLGGICQHCGEMATTIPTCADTGDAVDICQACVIQAFRMVADTSPGDGSN